MLLLFSLIGAFFAGIGIAVLLVVMGGHRFDTDEAEDFSPSADGKGHDFEFARRK